MVAYSQMPHGATIGRGRINDKQGGFLLYAGSPGATPVNFYFGGVASAWTNPAMPGTESVDASGALNAGTVYSKLWGVSGRDAKTTPTLTNIRGGHIRLIGGTSTGTAAGGNVELAVTLAGGASNNTENTETIRLTLSGSTGNIAISGALAVTGAITGGNLSGTNTRQYDALTTTGTTGAATSLERTLNLPNYVSGSGLTSLNALTGSTQTFATGTTGSDFAIVSSGDCTYI